MKHDQITRRAFVGTLGALALTVGAGLVGCGTASTSFIRSKRDGMRRGQRPLPLM